jgi:hypothetical protein
LSGAPPLTFPAAGARVRVIHDYRGAAMFVVELIYKADLEGIDARMRAHLAFL